jgi:beta-lactamase superfamily II metal-dependent hydrolase
MLEIDFLPVEATDGPGSKSGDAIAVRYSSDTQRTPFVAIIDGGYSSVGEQLVSHIRKHYATNHVDLVISTHPDADHINGLLRVLENMDVDELMLHLPWAHHDDVSEFSNVEKVRELYSLAVKRNVVITEPFSDGGIVRANGALSILGPSRAYYEELLTEDLGEAVVKASAFSTQLSELVEARLEKSHEPLSDTDTTSARNNSSVIVMLDSSDELHLFTGDAGITALGHAADFFEALGGDFARRKVEFFQVPHHGSRHNLGPAILDRLFPLGASGTTAFISSGNVDEKHPGLAVMDELRERGFTIHSTEGKLLLHGHDAPARESYYPAPQRY